MGKDKIVVVMPAYNAERTLKEVYTGIPNKNNLKVLLVDDDSKDKTVAVSKKLGLETIVHPKNMGYGANQKTCYKRALALGANYVIMLHPDGQYNPKDLLKFIKALKEKKGDLILGSRFLKHGDTETPLYKSISIRLITLAFNLVLGTQITEANTGYRGYTRKLLENVPFTKNGNGYLFDPQFIIQTVWAGFKIYDVPVSKRYNKEASSPNFKKSLYHGLENVSLLGQYLLDKLNLKKADFLTK